jgi:hypothetical protein
MKEEGGRLIFSLRGMGDRHDPRNAARPNKVIISLDNGWPIPDGTVIGAFTGRRQLVMDSRFRSPGGTDLRAAWRVSQLVL